jgi:hypothetical protein
MQLTLDKVRCVRQLTLCPAARQGETGRVLCEGEVLHRGGRVATAEGRVIAERTGKLLAHGTTTCLILSAAGAPPSGNGRG